MGVGDLTVPKRMQAFGEAFYGRAAAYDLALTDGREPLAQALCKNILNGEQHRKGAAARRLCRGGDRRPGGAGRRGVAGRIVEISLRRRQASATAMSRDRHDRQDRIPGAFPSPWRKSRKPDCIATSKPTWPCARRWPRSAACAKSSRRSASLDVTPKSGGRFHVAGRVRARIGQTCVVTLDPIENEIDEPIDLIFAPPEQIPANGRSGR